MKPEYKNRPWLITLIDSAGRYLNSIFNQEKLPIDGVLLRKPDGFFKMKYMAV